MKKFKSGLIQGVIVKELKQYQDSRGWLMELYREDELAKQYRPAMSYISETKPGVVRGPHEHVDQADYFCFIGPSDFQLFLWDNRKKSKTYGYRMILVAGDSWPASVIVPKGVVHAYRNIGKKNGWVFNGANRLYRGKGKKRSVDEIRHEADPKTPFKISR